MVCTACIISFTSAQVGYLHGNQIIASLFILGIVLGALALTSGDARSSNRLMVTLRYHRLLVRHLLKAAVVPLHRRGRLHL